MGLHCIKELTNLRVSSLELAVGLEREDGGVAVLSRSRMQVQEEVPKHRARVGIGHAVLETT